MSDLIRAEADIAFADGPIGAPNHPPKVEIRRLFKRVADVLNVDRQSRINGDAALAAQVAALANLVNEIEAEADSVTQETWTGLSGISGARVGQRGYVLDDGGSHTDPVVSGTVDNEGVYAWSDSPAGWQRLRDLVMPASGIVLPDGTEIATPSTDADYIIMDAEKQPALMVQSRDVHLAFAGASARFGWLAELDRQNIARAHAIQNRAHNVRLQPPAQDYLGILAYGQSLMFGNEGWPAISKAAAPNTLMIGNCERGYGTSTWAWNGSKVFNPLVAHTTDTSTTNNLTPEDEAALTAPSSHYGETMLTSIVRGLARGWQAKGYLPTRNWVALNAAAPGTPWEGLVKGASPNKYNRLVQATDAFMDIVEGLSASGSIPAVVWNGGQYNYRNDVSSTQDYAGVLALLTSIRDDLISDIASRTGQTLPPAFFVYQPSGSYVLNLELNGNGNAHLDFAMGNYGVWMIGPDYGSPDRNGLHLTSNGYRQNGQKGAQVARHVLIDGKDWQPTHPIWMLEVNDVLYVGFHAPCLPLQFKNPFTSGERVSTASRGFLVIDETGVINLKRPPYLVGASIMALEFGRPRNGLARFWAGRNPGRTDLCDSDTSLTDEVYEFFAPMVEADENIAELVGKPYPTENYCVIGSWACPTAAGVVTPAEF